MDANSQSPFPCGQAARLVLLAAPWMLAVFFVTAGLSVAVTFLLRQNVEFDCVYRQAALELSKGEDFYATKNDYVYPPFAAWLAIPIADFAILPARLLWLAINFAACWILISSAWQIARGGKLFGAEVEPREYLIFCCGLGTGMFYLLNAFNHTQTDIVIGALVMRGCLALSRGKTMTAAAWFGIASAFKCTPLLWIVYFVWRGRIVPAATVALLFVGLNLLPNFVAPAPGNSWWLSYWYERYLSGMTQPTAEIGAWHTLPRYNQSLNGAAQRLFFVDLVWTEAGFQETPRDATVNRHFVKLAVLAGEAMLALACLALMGRCGRPIESALNVKGENEGLTLRDGLDCSIVCMLMLLLSPMSGKAHFGLLILPGFCLARLAIVEKDRSSAFLLALGAPFVISGRIAAWEFGLHALWWGNVTMHALVLLAGCLHALRRERRITTASAAGATSVRPATAGARQPCVRASHEV